MRRHCKSSKNRCGSSQDSFYFSVFPDQDHQLWPEVLGAIGVPPINPTTGAKSWKGENTVGTQKVPIEVACVNNPAIDIYDFFLLQHKGDYKPLPLLSDVQPLPIPDPVEPPTNPIEVKSIQAGSDGSRQWSNTAIITFSDGTVQTERAPGDDSITGIRSAVREIKGVRYLICTINYHIKKEPLVIGPFKN